ncbi:hypothetical protein CEXT_159081 [Caerostris extrusa]|uniref:Uncharacterized protein n=1 Tax=Caerostris extrusa TaxID=172846 RepID=A0AAV4XQ85_CAEEX|nr:hypothetical protein CEXT_159081 [Caerostris extrusa]
MNSSVRPFIPSACLAMPTRIRKLISGPIALGDHIWQSTVQGLCGIFREMCENAFHLFILSTSVVKLQKSRLRKLRNLLDSRVPIPFSLCGPPSRWANSSKKKKWTVTGT